MIYRWDSKKGDSEPDILYRDIFYEDGTPYSRTEVDFIKKTKKSL